MADVEDLSPQFAQFDLQSLGPRTQQDDGRCPVQVSGNPCYFSLGTS